MHEVEAERMDAAQKRSKLRVNAIMKRLGYDPAQYARLLSLCLNSGRDP
jgi:hypothetical protein